jgi:hypothetical protein
MAAALAVPYARCRPSAVIRFLLVALSLSIGWGIRGNFGHEIGAMLPGALAAGAAVILSGREDWHRRTAYFMAAGALGWSAGGSMSYMQVIAYTHSGHSPTVLYGFACLFLLGFLWAAPGGAATALPAVLDRERLTAFFAPIATTAAVWFATDAIASRWEAANADFRHESPLYWYDTNWLQALGVLVSAAGVAAVRRRWDFANSMLFYSAAGWWIGFLALTPGLGLRMTPPRGDNWAGAVGMTAGMLVCLWRWKLPAAVYATLVAGFWGGFGFAGAAFIKLCWMKTGWSANWHSVLEQTYGFINGLGIAAIMFRLARKTPKVVEEPEVRGWTEPWATGFAVLGVTYLNLIQNTRVWVEHKAAPATMYGLSTDLWHEASWALIGAAFLILARRARGGRLPIAPSSGLGAAQWMYLILLWAMTVGNFMRALTGFAPQRLVTEGVIHLNSVLCTLGVLLCSPPAVAPKEPAAGWGGMIRRVSGIGLATAVACSFGLWGAVRAIYGDKPADGGKPHIRFGPNATATTAKPKAGQPHP